MSSNNPTSPKSSSTLLADFLASLVVFMVALPLCIGIAQACGLPPEAGVVTGIVGGLLVGFLAGSPLQVSGPAAGLIVLVIDFLEDAKASPYAANLSEADALIASVTMLGVAILLAGLIQILAGALRVGQWFRAVSPAVVEGMLAGIGVTIIAKQFHEMIDDVPPKGIVEGILTIPQAIWKALGPQPETAANHREAAIIGITSILILAFWKLLKLRVHSLKFIPAAVVAILVGVVLNEFCYPLFNLLGLAGASAEADGSLGVERVRISANLFEGLTPLPTHWPGWSILGSGLVLKAAITFAIIASAETLLCATAVDSMQTGPRTNYDRELIAQGVGNMVCGGLGALPMTGVVVRSSANVDAGAKTRLSAILHGVWLLLFVALLPALLSRIPASALAAVLVYTGWKLLNLPGLLKLWKDSRSEALIFVATAATIVGADLLAGVVLGIVLSSLKLLLIFSHLNVIRRDDPEQGLIYVVLEGAATFLRLPVLAEALEALPQKHTVHIHLDRIQFVDHAAMQMLLQFQKQYESTGGKVFVDWQQLRAQMQGPKPSPPRLSGLRRQHVPVQDRNAGSSPTDVHQ